MEMTTQDIQCYYKDKRQENRKTIFRWKLRVLYVELTKNQVKLEDALFFIKSMISMNVILQFISTL